MVTERERGWNSGYGITRGKGRSCLNEEVRGVKKKSKGKSEMYWRM